MRTSIPLLRRCMRTYISIHVDAYIFSTRRYIHLFTTRKSTSLLYKDIHISLYYVNGCVHLYLLRRWIRTSLFTMWKRTFLHQNKCLHLIFLLVDAYISSFHFVNLYNFSSRTYIYTYIYTLLTLRTVHLIDTYITSPHQYLLRIDSSIKYMRTLLHIVDTYIISSRKYLHCFSM